MVFIFNFTQKITNYFLLFGVQATIHLLFIFGEYLYIILGKHWKALASVNCSEPVNSTAALKSGDVNASAASARIEAKSG